MTYKSRHKKKPQRTINTRSFNSNIDLLNKLNSSEVPHSTETVQSNMASNSNSANDKQYLEVLKKPYSVSNLIYIDG